MKILISILIIFIALTANADIADSTKAKMFCTAIRNGSTAPNYVVVKVKNLKTGEIKEICTEAPFLRGAMRIQNKNSAIDCIKFKDRYFEFSKKKALKNIGYDLYSMSDLEKYKQTINLDSLVEQVEIGKLNGLNFSGEKKEQRMFAHLMFNNGIMVTRGCFSGNTLGLKFFKC